MHSPWVVGAHAAMFNVTTIVSLQNIQGAVTWALHSLPPQEPTPRRSFVPTHPPTPGWPLSNSVREAGPPPVPLPLSGALMGPGAYKEAARVSPGLSQCARAVWQFRQEVG